MHHHSSSYYPCHNGEDNDLHQLPLALSEADQEEERGSFQFRIVSTVASIERKAEDLLRDMATISFGWTLQPTIDDHQAAHAVEPLRQGFQQKLQSMSKYTVLTAIHLLLCSSCCSDDGGTSVSMSTPQPSPAAGDSAITYLRDSRRVQVAITALSHIARHVALRGAHDDDHQQQQQQQQLLQELEALLEVACSTNTDWRHAKALEMQDWQERTKTTNASTMAAGGEEHHALEEQPISYRATLRAYHGVHTSPSCRHEWCCGVLPTLVRGMREEQFVLQFRKEHIWARWIRRLKTAVETQRHDEDEAAWRGSTEGVVSTSDGGEEQLHQHATAAAGTTNGPEQTESVTTIVSSLSSDDDYRQDCADGNGANVATPSAPADAAVAALQHETSLVQSMMQSRLRQVDVELTRHLFERWRRRAHDFYDKEERRLWRSFVEASVVAMQKRRRQLSRQREATKQWQKRCFLAWSKTFVQLRKNTALAVDVSTTMTTQRCLTHWRQQLQMRMATKLARYNLAKNALCQWKEQYFLQGRHGPRLLGSLMAHWRQRTTEQQWAAAKAKRAMAPLFSKWRAETKFIRWHRSVLQARSPAGKAASDNVVVELQLKQGPSMVVLSEAFRRWAATGRKQVQQSLEREPNAPRTSTSSSKQRVVSLKPVKVAKTTNLSSSTAATNTAAVGGIRIPSLRNDNLLKSLAFRVWEYRWQMAAAARLHLHKKVWSVWRQRTWRSQTAKELLLQFEGAAKLRLKRSVFARWSAQLAAVPSQRTRVHTLQQQAEDWFTRRVLKKWQTMLRRRLGDKQCVQLVRATQRSNLLSRCFTVWHKRHQQDHELRTNGVALYQYWKKRQCMNRWLQQAYRAAKQRAHKIVTFQERRRVLQRAQCWRVWWMALLRRRIDNDEAKAKHFYQHSIKAKVFTHWWRQWFNQRRIAMQWERQHSSHRRHGEPPIVEGGLGGVPVEAHHNIRRPPRRELGQDHHSQVGPGFDDSVQTTSSSDEFHSEETGIDYTDRMTPTNVSQQQSLLKEQSNGLNVSRRTSSAVCAPSQQHPRVDASSQADATARWADNTTGIDVSVISSNSFTASSSSRRLASLQSSLSAMRNARTLSERHAYKVLSHPTTAATSGGQDRPELHQRQEEEEEIDGTATEKSTVATTATTQQSSPNRMRLHRPLNSMPPPPSVATPDRDEEDGSSNSQSVAYEEEEDRGQDDSILVFPVDATATTSSVDEEEEEEEQEERSLRESSGDDSTALRVDMTEDCPPSPRDSESDLHDTEKQDFIASMFLRHTDHQPMNEDRSMNEDSVSSSSSSSSRPRGSSSMATAAVMHPHLESSGGCRGGGCSGGGPDILSVEEVETL